MIYSSILLPIKQLFVYLLVIFALIFTIDIPIFAAITCTNSQKKCVEGENETRYIDGVPVSPGCWKTIVTYECREESDNNCKELREQGCSQVNAKCKTMLNNSCVIQDALYRCPVEKCNEFKKINCAKNLFCADGKCASTTPMENKNFDKAAASLAALAAAAKEVAEQNTEDPIIFSGRAKECSKNIAGAKNCCGINAEGWAEGVLLNCDDEEMELAKDKGNKKTIYVGEYCHNEILGVCTSYHHVYCVFDSKISRIIQNDGRWRQLGIGFGDAENPNCRGISKEELTRMDFRKMDFSDLYSDIRSNLKIPDSSSISQKAASSSIGELAEKSTKGLPISNEENAGLKAAERIKEFYSERKK